MVRPKRMQVSVIICSSGSKERIMKGCVRYWGKRFFIVELLDNQGREQGVFPPR
jgi:hypothetical protein